MTQSTADSDAPSPQSTEEEGGTSSRLDVPGKEENNKESKSVFEQFEAHMSKATPGSQSTASSGAPEPQSTEVWGGSHSRLREHGTSNKQERRSIKSKQDRFKQLKISYLGVIGNKRFE